MPAARSLTTSRQIVSDATAEPPGLLTRSSTARTRSSDLAERSAAATVSEPMAPPTGPRLLRPCLIGPDAWISATKRSRGFGRWRARCAIARDLAYRATYCRTASWPTSFRTAA